MPWTGRSDRPTSAERVRRWLATPVAFLASAVAVLCTISVADVAPALLPLSLTNERLVGWAGAGVAAACAVAVLALVTMRRTGAGPVLALGAASSVFGLALADNIVDGTQLAIAALTLGVAVGALLTGAAGMALELPSRYRTPTLLAFVVPLVVGSPLVTWWSLRSGDADSVELTVHPPVGLLAPVTGLIVLWAVISMLIEAPRAHAEPLGWEPAWAMYVGVLVAASVAVMLLGFEPDVDRGWLRSLVMLVVAVVLAGMALVLRAVPSGQAAAGFAVVSLAGLAGPACVQLLVIVSDAGDVRVDWPVLGLLVAGGLVGVAAGWRWHFLASAVAPLVLAAAAAGAWVMPDAAWPMVAAAGPFMAAFGAALAAGVRLCTVSPMALRFGVLAVVASTSLGAVLSLALGWTLAGDVAASTDTARSAGRVLLGLTFAAAVLAAAYVVTRDRASSLR